MQALPKTLKREPIVDAVFEIRFDAMSDRAEILPGILFQQIDPKPKMERLPTADIPQPLRSNNPNLRYAHIQRLDLGNFFVLLGDRSLAVTCKMPYPNGPCSKKRLLKF